MPVLGTPHTNITLGCVSPAYSLRWKKPLPHQAVTIARFHWLEDTDSLSNMHPPKKKMYPPRPPKTSKERVLQLLVTHKI